MYYIEIIQGIQGVSHFVISPVLNVYKIKKRREGKKKHMICGFRWCRFFHFLTFLISVNRVWHVGIGKVLELYTKAALDLLHSFWHISDNYYSSPWQSVYYNFQRCHYSPLTPYINKCTTLLNEKKYITIHKHIHKYLQNPFFSW